MKRSAGVTLLLVPALLHGVARADEVRRLGFAERGPNLVVSGSFTEVFDETHLEALSSGFATLLVVRTVVRRGDGPLPVAVSARTVRVIYDLWGEEYRVRTDDPGGSRERRVATRAEALREATSLRELPVAPLHAVAVGPLHDVEVMVALNPVSPELLAEVRRWLARPAARGVAGSGGFFGAFVSVFVNPRIEEAERVLRFRSQPFYRVPR